MIGAGGSGRGPGGGGSYTVAAVGRRDRLQGLLLRDDLAPAAAEARCGSWTRPAIQRWTLRWPVGGARVAAGLSRADRVPAGQAATGSRCAGRARVHGRDRSWSPCWPGDRRGRAGHGDLGGGARQGGEPRELFAFGDATGSRAAPAGGIRTGAGGTAIPTGTRLAETGPGGGRGRGVAVPPGPGPGSPGPCGGAGRGGDGHVAPRIGLSDAVGDARPTPAPPPRPADRRAGGAGPRRLRRPGRNDGRLGRPAPGHPGTRPTRRELRPPRHPTNRPGVRGWRPARAPRGPDPRPRRCGW